jgi:tRNA A37 threonylcarbamoyladenosine biosynthesis protein TsaE
LVYHADLYRFRSEELSTFIVMSIWDEPNALCNYRMGESLRAIATASIIKLLSENEARQIGTTVSKAGQAQDLNLSLVKAKLIQTSYRKTNLLK